MVFLFLVAEAGLELTAKHIFSMFSRCSVHFGALYGGFWIVIEYIKERPKGKNKGNFFSTPLYISSFYIPIIVKVHNNRKDIKTMKKYTLQELTQKTDREFFTAEEICFVVGSDPQTIRLQARLRPDLLGFPAIVIGNRVKIPRIPFLRYMGVDI